MASTALLGWLLFAALAFGLRSFLQWRWTGSTGFLGLSGRLGSIERLAGVLFIAACVLCPLAPVLVRAGRLRPWPPLDTPVVHGVGIVLFVAGLCGTLWAQVVMGDSWRIGVDTRERTALVVVGPFRWMRNPIYTAMLLAATGLGLLVPSPVSALAVAVVLAAVEVQVRAVEEPYLLRVHGAAYRRWAARTGRFVPGLGRLDGTAHDRDSSAASDVTRSR